MPLIYSESFLHVIQYHYISLTTHTFTITCHMNKSILLVMVEGSRTSETIKNHLKGI